MRECRELTRAKEPAFLSEASIADVNEQLAATLGIVTTQLKPEKEAGTRTTSLVSLHSRTRTTTTVGGGIAPFPVSHPSDCLGAR